MFHVIRVVITLVFLVSAGFAQAPDTLMLGDFENETLGPWSGWGDACESAQVVFAPDSDENHVLESIIDCGRDGEKKAGFANESMSIIVDGDTADTMVMYVWVDEGLTEELNICQVWCMDVMTWQWGNNVYIPNQLIENAWNRLEYPYQNSFDNIDGFTDNVGAGLACGVEFVFNEDAGFGGVIYGDDIYLLFENKGTTAVDNSPVLQPGSLQLEPNFPNPFNPVTHIAYTLPHADYVTITLHDMQGRLVQTLVQNEPQPAGRVALMVDASDLASGVYTCRVQTSTAVESIKMTLLK